MKESDLYPPLKEWLTRQGYVVRGEVGRCDIAAEKNGKLIVIEMKLRPSLTLLSQASERQDYADSVYIALPDLNRKRSPVSKDLRRLLKRLGIGFIAVAFLKTRIRVKVLFHPAPLPDEHGENKNVSIRRPKRRRAILREIAGRDLDITPGGIPGGMGRVTAYRQRCVKLAVWLSELGEMSPAGLQKMGAPSDTGTILRRNIYGWFIRVSRGIYKVHSAGLSAMADVPELAEIYRRELQQKQNSTPGTISI